MIVWYSLSENSIQFEHYTLEFSKNNIDVGTYFTCINKKSKSGLQYLVWITIPSLILNNQSIPLVSQANTLLITYTYMLYDGYYQKVNVLYELNLIRGCYLFHIYMHCRYVKQNILLIHRKRKQSHYLTRLKIQPTLVENFKRIS